MKIWPEGVQVEGNQYCKSWLINQSGNFLRAKISPNDI